MLAVGQRLRRHDEFTAAVRAGRRAARGGVVVHLVANQPQDGATGDAAIPAGPRAGFIVPRSIGGAVTRNRVRRRLRHLVRSRLRRLEPGTDMVVRVLPVAVARSYIELGHDLDAAIAAARDGGGRRSR